MGAAAWAAQPAARRLDCASDCAASVGTAIDGGGRLLVIEGDATIVGPANFGSADDPIVIVATGALTLSGDIEINGVVACERARMERHDARARRRPWRRRSPASYRGNGAVDLHRDAAVLTRLAAGNGSFVRINGSWKDFQ